MSIKMMQFLLNKYASFIQFDSPNCKSHRLTIEFDPALIMVSAASLKSRLKRVIDGTGLPGSAAVQSIVASMSADS